MTNSNGVHTICMQLSLTIQIDQCTSDREAEGK
jgi:hypothetical protein